MIISGKATECESSGITNPSCVCSMFECWSAYAVAQKGALSSPDLRLHGYLRLQEHHALQWMLAMMLPVCYHIREQDEMSSDVKLRWRSRK